MKLRFIFFSAIVWLPFNFLHAQGVPSNAQGLTQWKTNGNIADSAHFIGTKNDFPLKFRVNDIERFRITPEGNLGIGTSTPQAKLDVNGSVWLRNSLILSGLNFSNGLTLGDLLTVDGNGNVTKAPWQEIQNLIYSKNCPANPNEIIPNPVWTNGPNKIIVECPQVKVGIGTLTPRVKLDVIGTTFSTDLALGMLPSTMFGMLEIKNSSHDAAIHIDQLGNNGDFDKLIFAEVDDPTTEIIKVVNPLTQQIPFLLTADGSISVHNGLKKTLQLDNNGILHTREVIVDLLDWPDYVFEKEYPLMNLSDVESYIKENGHLPNVPSAENVIEEGLNVGEMNKVLIEKIEELTIHLIEQDKRIKELEKMIKEN